MNTGRGESMFAHGERCTYQWSKVSILT